jgi:hypothetical protein
MPEFVPYRDTETGHYVLVGPSKSGRDDEVHIVYGPDSTGAGEAYGCDLSKRVVNRFYTPVSFDRVANTTIVNNAQDERLDDLEARVEALERTANDDTVTITKELAARLSVACDHAAFRLEEMAGPLRPARLARQYREAKDALQEALHD